MSSTVAGKEIEAQAKQKTGARPFTGIEALWDKIDGTGASLIVSGGLALMALVVGFIVNIFLK